MCYTLRTAQPFDYPDPRIVSADLVVHAVPVHPLS